MLAIPLGQHGLHGVIVQEHAGKEFRQELGNVKEAKSVLNRILALGKVKKKESALHGVAKVRTR